MGDKDDSLSQAPLQFEKFALQFGPGDGIKCAERLVHQENRRIGGEGAGHADPLPLSAGKFAGIARGDFGVESDQLHEFVYACLDSIGGPIFDLRHKADIARDGEVREETDLLDDVADARGGGG